MNFSQTGYTPRTVLEIRNAISARMKAAFGENFDVTTSSPDGQIIGIVAQEIWELEQEGFALFQSLSPLLASGVSLDYAVGYNDLKRIVDRPCSVMLSLDGTAGTIIPKGSVVATTPSAETQLEFETNIEVILPATVMSTCTTLGNLNVNAGEVTEIVTPVSGWTDVTNPEDGLRGIVYESDAQLRARQVRTLEARGSQSASTIQAALVALGLEYLAVIENYTDAEVDGVPANSFEVVVKGGEPNQIAALINAERPIGIRAHGSTIVPVTDTLGQVRQIGFTRPTSQNIIIQVDVVKKQGASNDVESQIKFNLTEFINSLTVGQDVEWATLFAPISAIPNITITALLVAKEGGTLGTATVEIEQREFATTNASLIAVNIT